MSISLITHLEWKKTVAYLWVVIGNKVIQLKILGTLNHITLSTFSWVPYFWWGQDKVAKFPLEFLPCTHTLTHKIHSVLERPRQWLPIYFPSPTLFRRITWKKWVNFQIKSWWENRASRESQVRQCLGFLFSWLLVQCWYIIGCITIKTFINLWFFYKLWLRKRLREGLTIFTRFSNVLPHLVNININLSNHGLRNNMLTRQG